ncbi:Uncharacterised protein [uncultured archaeon]|nr:Uncharacterised protein [uncultured archaeon]
MSNASFSLTPSMFMLLEPVGLWYRVSQAPVPAYVEKVVFDEVHCGEQSLLYNVEEATSLSHITCPVEPVGFHSKSAGRVVIASTSVSMLLVTAHVFPSQYAVCRSFPLSTNTACRFLLDAGSVFRVKKRSSLLSPASMSNRTALFHALPSQ